MNFQTGLLLISFTVSIILSLFFIPILKKIKIGQIEREDGPKSHLKKQGTPTMGGIIFIISIVLCSFGTYIFCKIKNYTEYINNLIPMLCLIVGFGLIGFIDDFKKLVKHNTDGLKPKAKMMGLFIISLLFVIFIILVKNTEIIIPILKITWNMPKFLYIPFAILVILASTNAINLTDGVDGLSSSVCAIIIATLTVISMLNSTNEVSTLGAIGVGSILGFLMFNLHPAKVMMGDTGSLFLGGLISCMALYLKIPLLLVIIALIPILETLSVIIQVSYYKKTGNRIFKMAPLHHHFELSGWNENKIVRFFSLVTLIMCIIGILVI